MKCDIIRVPVPGVLLDGYEEDIHRLLVNAICGIDPSYLQMQFLEKKELGYFTGGMSDRWTYDESKVRLLSIDELIKVYTYLTEGEVK